MILGVAKVDQRFQRSDKRKTLGDVLQSPSIKLEQLLVADKLEAYVRFGIKFFHPKAEDDLS